MIVTVAIGRRQLPWALLAVGSLLVGAGLVAFLVDAALVLPSLPLDFLWRMKPAARGLFESMGWAAVALLAVVGAVSIAAGLGLLSRRRWGWGLAVAVLAINGLGDVGKAIAQRDVTALSGVVIVGGLVTVLWLPSSRRALRRGEGYRTSRNSERLPKSYGATKKTT